MVVFSHLRTFFMEAGCGILDTSVWCAIMGRKDPGLAVKRTGMGMDDADAAFYEGRASGGEWSHESCRDRELRRKMDDQSPHPRPATRRSLVRKDGLAPQRGVARPMLRRTQGGACRHPHARGITVGANSIYGHWRMKEAWLAPR